MPKCPHCGEVIAAGQERCFACGQSVKHGRRMRKSPLSGPLIIGAALLLVAGAVGTVVMLTSHKKQDAKAAQEEELRRVQDSVRAANRAQRETTKTVRRDATVSRLVRELDEVDDRFQMVKRQVVVGDATPEQQKLINEVQSRLGQLRSAAQGATLKPEGAERDQAEDAVRDGLREVRSTISKLTRAPKNKPAPA
ncbi:MAG: zinc ribbon domain-containing protein, partial [bacterium]